jgi:hypothetical protein
MALQQYAAMRSPACYLIVVASIKGPLKLGFEAALVGFPPQIFGLRRSASRRQ